MITMTFTTLVIIVILFVYRRAIKQSANMAETAITVAVSELEKETLVLAESHENSVKERLIEIREEARDLNLDTIDLNKELTDFRKKYGIRKR